MFLSACTLTFFLLLAYPRDSTALVDNNNHLAINHVSYFPEVAMFPDIHYKIENDAAVVNAADSGAAQPSRDFPHQSYGSAFVRTSFVHEMQVKSNRHISGLTANDNNFELERLQTKHLSASSKLHKDCVREGDEEIRVNGPTGFFFRNTNPDAYFETYDGNLCIPIIEGNFVYFDGNKPHRTVINSGHVDLLGPIELTSKDKVMMLLHDDDPDHCQAPKSSGKISSSTESRRNLEGGSEDSVDGIVYIGETSPESPEQGNYIMLEAPTSLNCTDCKLSLTDAQECTDEELAASSPLYDSTLSIDFNPFPIDFSIDDIGATGYFFFVFENGLDPEDTFNNTLVLYDGDIQIACATLEELDVTTASGVVDQWQYLYHNTAGDRKRVLAEEKKSSKNLLRH